jgi:hypothetical protein
MKHLTSLPLEATGGKGTAWRGKDKLSSYKGGKSHWEKSALMMEPDLSGVRGGRAEIGTSRWRLGEERVQELCVVWRWKPGPCTGAPCL